MGYRTQRSINWGCVPALAFVLFFGVPLLAGFMMGQSMARGEDAAMPYGLSLATSLTIIVGVGILSASIMWLTNKLFSRLATPFSNAAWKKALISVSIAIVTVGVAWEISLLLQG